MTTYTIDKPHLLDLIKEEVSHVADRAYGDDGASLYDTIIILDRHADKIDRYLEDSIQVLLTIFYDVARRAGDAIQFDLPDFDSANLEQAQRRIDRFLALNTVLGWLAEVYAEAVPDTEKTTKAAFADVIAILRTRAEVTKRFTQL